MNERLLALVDRHEIWQVLQKYGRAMDRFDVELARSCYFEDAVDDHGRFVGRAYDLIAWANKAMAGFVSHQHSMLNHFCDLQGDDAYTETYFVCICVAQTPPHLASTGRYIDHFQRRHGEWRIANRVMITEKNFELQDSSKWPGIPDPSATGDVQPVTRDRNDVSYHRPPRPRAFRQP